MEDVPIKGVAGISTGMASPFGNLKKGNTMLMQHIYQQSQ